MILDTCLCRRRFGKQVIKNFDCSSGKADVIFRPGKVNGEDMQALDEARSFKATSTEAYYSMAGAGTFLVRAGKEGHRRFKPRRR